MKVSTRNHERTMDEMTVMWYWMVDAFGPPEAHNGNKKRWTYGKDPDWVGSTFCNGSFEIEWFEFYDEKDAEWFILRWA